MKLLGPAAASAGDAIRKSELDAAIATVLGDAGFGPLDYGLLGWSTPFEQATTGLAMTSGTATLTRMKAVKSGTVTSIIAHVTTAGAALTFGRLQIYDTTGALLAQSADQSTIWTVTGQKTTALVTPISVVAGTEYWVVQYAVGTTGPTFRSGAAASSLNVNLTSSSPFRVGRKSGVVGDLSAVVKTDYSTSQNAVPMYAFI